jgi:DnaJ-class molecular chaperone
MSGNIFTDTDPIDIDREYDEDDYGDELECTLCGGDGFVENDDPLWYGFDTPFIQCTACGGSGKRKDQTIF